jgi:hypothetical protein
MPQTVLTGYSKKELPTMSLGICSRITRRIIYGIPNFLEKERPKRVLKTIHKKREPSNGGLLKLYETLQESAFWDLLKKDNTESKSIRNDCR